MIVSVVGIDGLVCGFVAMEGDDDAGFASSGGFRGVDLVLASGRAVDVAGVAAAAFVLLVDFGFTAGDDTDDASPIEGSAIDDVLARFDVVFDVLAVFDAAFFASLAATSSTDFFAVALGFRVVTGLASSVVADLADAFVVAFRTPFVRTDGALSVDSSTRAFLGRPIRFSCIASAIFESIVCCRLNREIQGF